MLKSTSFRVLASLLLLLLAGCGGQETGGARTTPPTPPPSASPSAERPVVVEGSLVDDYSEYSGEGDLCESRRVESGTEVQLNGVRAYTTSLEAGEVTDGGCYFRFYFGAVQQGAYDLEFGDSTSELSVDEDLEPVLLRVLPDWSEAELAYLQAVGTEPEDDDAAVEVREAQAVCDMLAGYERESALSNVVERREDSGYLEAIEHLCPDNQRWVEEAEGAFDDGSYSVRTEGGVADGVIQPGTYRTLPGVEDCYWERVDDVGNTRSNELVRFAPEGVEVTLLDTGGGFVTERCGVWIRQ